MFSFFVVVVKCCFSTSMSYRQIVVSLYENVDEVNLIINNNNNSDVLNYYYYIQITSNNKSLNYGFLVVDVHQ